MPIDVKTFRDAQWPLKERIYRFLSAHPESAFNLVEVISGVDAWDRSDLRLVLLIEDASRPDSIRSRFRGALNELIADGKVAKAIVQGAEYFAVVVESSP